MCFSNCFKLTLHTTIVLLGKVSKNSSGNAGLRRDIEHVCFNRVKLPVIKAFIFYFINSDRSSSIRSQHAENKAKRYYPTTIINNVNEINRSKRNCVCRNIFLVRNKPSISSDDRSYVRKARYRNHQRFSHAFCISSV